MSESDPGPMVTVALQLPASHYGHLQECAARAGITTSGLMRQIVALWLNARRNPPRPAAPEPAKRGGRGPARRKPQPMVAPAQPAPLSVNVEEEIASLETEIPA